MARKNVGLLADELSILNFARMVPDSLICVSQIEEKGFVWEQFSPLITEGYFVKTKVRIFDPEVAYSLTEKGNKYLSQAEEILYNLRTRQ